MKFDSRYSVEIVFDGSKLGIEPYVVLAFFKLRVQQCLAFHLELLNEAEVAAVAEEKETHSFEIDPS
ncbi:hypothetical protein GYH30_010037 [Glycine max]|nr:hypothetical protein GYH30_010037 [Glycine max]